MAIIHILLGKANPERLNGVNKVVHQMATAMIGQGIPTEVWGITSTTESNPLQTTYLRKLFIAPANSFVLPASLKSVLSTLTAKDVVHFHGVLIPVYYRICRFLKRRNIPWVITPHGALQKQSLCKNYLFKVFYLYLLEKFVLDNSHCIQCITEEEKANSTLFKNNSVVIRNAYDGPQDIRRTELSSIPRFGYLGRMDKDHKGLDFLLSGFNRYIQNGGKGTLHLVGDGPDKDWLAHQVNHTGLNGHVRFHQPVFGQEKMDLLLSLDAFLHPSRWDVVPTAVLEAGWHGLPLIVSRHIGFTKALPKWQAGILLEQNDATHICEALVKFEECYYDKSLAIIGENARQMIEHDFNWTPVVGQLIAKLYPAGQS